MTESDYSALESILTKFEQLLGSERIAIRQSDIAQIEDTAERKLALLNDINGIMQRSGTDLDTLIKSDDRSGRLAAIRALAKRCSQANKANGAAIESSQNFTRSLLDILNGRTPGARTYTASGRLGDSASAGAIARA